MKRSQLEKVYFKKKAPDSLTKFKNQKNYCSRRCKKERKNISKVLIQEGSVKTKVFGKIYKLFSLKDERLAITLADDKENTTFEEHLVLEK